MHVEFPISNKLQFKFYESLVHYALISYFCRLVQNAIFLQVTYKIVSGTMANNFPHFSCPEIWYEYIGENIIYGSKSFMRMFNSQRAHQTM